ncbi:MAG TPA: hypothetical protein P5072_16445, partial [Parvularculaceae bacterium]|nr:hypothetical protein [Parvularculaceae bacterium]
VELARAVAKNLFKLMAYKDEYEVARLYTDGAFRKALADQFEGDYTLKFHMAPPVFNRGVDAEGRPKKSQFGPWMYGALSVLAKFRFLRGTALDIFGMTEERRLERRMIGDYRARIAALADGLTADALIPAIAIASLPADIRGYGPVKLESVKKAEARLELLEKELQKAVPAAKVA